MKHKDLVMELKIVKILQIAKRIAEDELPPETLWGYTYQAKQIAIANVLKAMEIAKKYE